MNTQSYPWLNAPAEQLMFTAEALIDQFNAGDFASRSTPRLPGLKYRQIHVPTYLHGVRSASYVGVVAAVLSQSNTEELALSAALRDIGKIDLGGLAHAGPLTDEQIFEVKCHGRYGYDLLSGLDSQVATIVEQGLLTHHERIDGTGYPQGTKGEDIPFVGRLVGALDMLDAVTNPRPYAPRWTWTAAIQYLRQEAGHLYDRNVVEAICERLQDLQIIESICISYEYDLLTS